MVSDAFDAADDWIAEQADAQDGGHHRRHLARRPLPEGRRDRHRPQRQAVHHRLDRRRNRDPGDHGRLARRGRRRSIGGPAPFAKADRSRFLQALDEALVRLARG